MMNRSKALLVSAIGCLAMMMIPPSARAEANEVRFGIQAGSIHLPYAIMEHERLIEKHAKEEGLGGLQVKWINFAGGAALSDSSSEIDSHFSTLPYLYRELAMPGVHAVLGAQDIFGVPFSNGILFTSKAFHDQNPKIVAATIAALKDALALIQHNPRLAAKIYIESSGDKSTVDTIAGYLTKPGTSYSITPHGMLRTAQFMHHIDMINKEPATWRDLFFKEAHQLSGS